MTPVVAELVRRLRSLTLCTQDGSISRASQETDSLARLPQDLIEKIFSELNLEDGSRLASTCHSFCQIHKSQRLAKLLSKEGLRLFEKRYTKIHPRDLLYKEDCLSIEQFFEKKFFQYHKSTPNPITIAHIDLKGAPYLTDQLLSEVLKTLSTLGMLKLGLSGASLETLEINEIPNLALEELDLNGQRLSESGTKKLSALTNKCKNLKRLKLKGATLGEHNKLLIKTIANQWGKTLEELQLIGSDFSKGSSLLLLGYFAVGKFKKIKTLSFPKLCNISLPNLTTAISEGKLKSLEQLHVSHCLDSYNPSPNSPLAKLEGAICKESLPALKEVCFLREPLAIGERPANLKSLSLPFWRLGLEKLEITNT